ncbi:hypothetical protein AS156_18195 [Bradyrhizobium macuxiense]|uniref:Uncharacterized protein n=1 Tax=Bradyrhizobium macuxiense TaxID=1755647 RepID=A0A120FJ20_9BRAD|nr:hypothetical protein AS156_18195 [Bradyrhizobium macuxiense]
MLTRLFTFLRPVRISPDLSYRLCELADDCDQLHRMVTTSPLWWADPECNWIPILSRFYRLSSPAATRAVRDTPGAINARGLEDGA